MLNSDTFASAAVYYGMVEEIDHWVGKLLDVLEAKGQFDNTMIIFTSDHGEMLGSHGTSGKRFLLEEGVRVPLIVSLPKQGQRESEIKPVTNPVSHLDLFSTILDYLGAPKRLNKSDGESLRRFIEKTSYNKDFDETVVVAEYDFREPRSKQKLSGAFGEEPSLMVRKGPFKLILPRASVSPIPDMMYDLKSDP
jgi:arylsulfatase A-like enzyme